MRWDGAAVVMTLVLASCNPAKSAGEADAPAPVPVATVTAVASSEPEAPARDPEDPWTALPSSAAQVGAYFDSLCAHMTEDGKVWRDKHLPPEGRKVVGHQPFTNDLGTNTWSSPRSLEPVMPFYKNERTLTLCERPRVPANPVVEGRRARGRIDIEQQPFLYTLMLADGTVRLERLTLELAHTEDKVRLTSVPKHAMRLLSDDLTNVEGGKRIAEIVGISANASMCFDAHILAEEARPNPELVASMATVTLEDGATVLSDGFAPISLLRCLQAELRSYLPLIPTVKTFQARHPDLSRRPVARIRMLVLLEAHEVDPGTPTVTSP